MNPMNTALIFWVCCVGYPAFTLLQTSALIWLIWQFRDELYLKASDALAWRPRYWRMRHLPKWSPYASAVSLGFPRTLLAEKVRQEDTVEMERADSSFHLALTLGIEDSPNDAYMDDILPMVAEVHA